MDLSSETIGVFYQYLGKLFYAIAAADKVVHPSEYGALQKIVTSNWIRQEDSVDPFGQDNAYQIEIVFDWLEDSNQTAEACFDEFTAYYKEHPSLFTTEIKRLIRYTADAIANAFAQKNKSELILLGKLQLLFDAKPSSN